jgi:hypothetical protein
MSKIALTPSATGTGVFSILSPATNTDRTLTLPDEAGTVLTSASSLASANLTGTVTVSGGNVGIGTASPSGELDVTASKASAVTNLYVRNPDNSGGAAIRVQSQTDAHQAILGITDAGSGGRVGTLTNDDFYFVTNNTERLRIDSSGNLLVGKTSPSLSTAGFEATSQQGTVYIVRNSDTPCQINRLGNDGPLVGFYQATLHLKVLYSSIWHYCIL